MFVFVVGIGWVGAWFGLALLWAVVVDYGSGVDFSIVCHWVLLLEDLCVC